MRIYPSFAQQSVINKNINAARFYYNFLVAQDDKLRRIGKEPEIYVKCISERREQILSQSYGELKPSIKRDKEGNEIFRLTRQGKLNYVRNTYPWMRDNAIDAHMFDNVIISHKNAWERCKTSGFGAPTYHKKSYEGSYQTNSIYQNKEQLAKGLFGGSVRFSGDAKKILLPKIGWVRCKYSPKIMGRLLKIQSIRIGTVTIRRSGVGYYEVSLQLSCKTPFVQKLPKLGDSTIVGIDLNVKNYLTDSNNKVVDNPKYYRRMEYRLNYAKRKLGKRQARAKEEGRPLQTARNYQKQREKVAKLARRVTNQRKAFLHEVAMTYIKNHDIIVVEKLQSRNMIKNHRYAKSLQDAGHGMFRVLLKQKAEMYGRTFVEVDPRYTTQTCHSCGFVMKENQKLTPDNREWTCPSCHTFLLRDYNAALNILEKGMKTLEAGLVSQSACWQRAG